MVEYSLRNLRRILQKPSLLLGEINRQATRLNAQFHQWFYTNNGIRVMDQDWDNLIILDGCRYDIFAERSELPGDLQRVTSIGSESPEFLHNNFDDNQYHDTVYVSANPYASRFTDGTFYKLVELYSDHWDPEYETILPETVAKSAIQIYEQNPDKRIIVHFMQPHFPFIGVSGRELNHTGIVHENFNPHDDDGNKRYPVWSNLRFGFTNVSEEEVWKAYAENLDIVLEHVAVLLEQIDGKTVVTSDHGNLIGERLSPIPVRGYGHPAHIRIPELVEVPWLVIDTGTRRKTTVEQPPSRSITDSEVIEDRLRHFGYL